jgi:hypothetical protein
MPERLIITLFTLAAMFIGGIFGKWESRHTILKLYKCLDNLRDKNQSLEENNEDAYFKASLHYKKNRQIDIEAEAKRNAIWQHDLDAIAEQVAELRIENRVLKAELNRKV